jgi:uncharacterized phiE125 gp8 family phage protein
MSLTLVTAPTADPVSVFDLKTALRIDGALEDAYLLTCIRRAQAHLAERDGWTGVVCLTSTWDLRLDEFPAGRWLRECAIRMPVRPVQSVTSVKYINGEGVEQTLATSEYVVHLEDPSPTLIVPAYGKVWPSTRAQLNAVTVRFVAGWTGPAAISHNVRNAIIVAAGHFYTHRDDGVPLPDDLLGSLLANERVYA